MLFLFNEMPAITQQATEQCKVSGQYLIVVIFDFYGYQDKEKYFQHYFTFSSWFFYGVEIEIENISD